MSIRALWIISLEKGDHVSLRFSKRFSTVEHRAKLLAGTAYVPVPDEDIVLQLLLTELGLSDPEKAFVSLRDDCSHCPRSPALELRLSGCEQDTLWPVLTVSQGTLILACLPLVDVPTKPRPPLFSLLSVSKGLTLLSGLQTFLLSSGGKHDPEGLASRLALLPSVLLQICPLGTPLDVPLAGPPATSTTVLPVGNQKQPAWKTGLHRGRAVVNVALTEVVRSMQYGNPNRQDLWDVYGTVTCKCEVEGVLPNVTVTLTLPPNGSPLQDILVHPCVTSVDSSILTATSVENGDSSAFWGPYKFPSLLLLSPSDYAAILLRDLMSAVEVKVNHGQVDASKEKNLLVWIIGQKFPKSREVSLEGKVSFGGPVPGPTDPMCSGLTAYIKLYFKVPDLTLSGCSVDQHSVQVYSTAKPKIFTARELQSSDYFIWNSTGTAPVSSGQMML
ncbi:hypothetical protein WMY93_017322 [Mugilogobius chulae]|uniref:AP-5 complex subunit mu-1 n=1 Tax=Mugilogobius chulae TaxID=88201 RepID=A0AAW0NSP4_9GOBI